MNLKDMQLLIATIKEIDTARAVTGDISRNREINTVIANALLQHRYRVIAEFEDRHNITIDKGILTHDQV